MKLRYGKVLAGIVVFFAAILFALPQTETVHAKDKDGDYVIVIDPGHGATDSGAVSIFTRDKECDLNWNIAVALKAELQTYAGVKVYLTRGSAEFQSNVGRSSMGRELEADYLIGVHNNSTSSSSANGIVCYGTVVAEYKEAAKKICLAVASEVNKLGIKLYNSTGYTSRASSYSNASDYYTFLGEASRSGIPSLIIEHCFISNESDANFVHQLANQYKMGAADATGIAKALGLSKRGVAPGQDITLTRTYSAYITESQENTYHSSDENVVKIRQDGLITAAKPGSAVITFKDKSGAEKSIQVTVPDVKMVGLSAGIVQKCFISKEQAYAYDTNSTMVKATYSDGSAVQVNGYSTGDLYLGTPYDEGGGHIMTPVCRPITYNGMTCTLRFYYFAYEGQVTNSTSTSKVIGTNKEILLVPGAYTGITGEGPIQVTENPKPTQPPTEPTKQSENNSQSSPTQSEPKSDNDEDSQTKHANKNVKDIWFIVICVILLILIVGAAVFIIMTNQRSSKHSSRRRHKKRPGR